MTCSTYFRPVLTVLDAIQADPATVEIEGRTASRDMGSVYLDWPTFERLVERYGLEPRMYRAGPHGATFEVEHHGWRWWSVQPWALMAPDQHREAVSRLTGRAA